MSNTDEDTAEEEAIVARDALRQWAVSIATTSNKKAKIDHRLLTRKSKRKFRHDEALHCINRDYIATVMT